MRKFCLGAFGAESFTSSKKKETAPCCVLDAFFWCCSGQFLRWLMVAPELKKKWELHFLNYLKGSLKLCRVFSSRSFVHILRLVLGDIDNELLSRCRCCFVGDVESVLHNHHYGMMCLFVVWQFGKIRLHQRIVSVGYLQWKYLQWNTVWLVLVERKTKNKHICRVKEIHLTLSFLQNGYFW